MHWNKKAPLIRTQVHGAECTPKFHFLTFVRLDFMFPEFQDQDHTWGAVHIPVEGCLHFQKPLNTELRPISEVNPTA